MLMKIGEQSIDPKVVTAIRWLPAIGGQYPSRVLVHYLPSDCIEMIRCKNDDDEARDLCGDTANRVNAALEKELK